MKVLQIGKHNWAEQYEIDESVEWDYCSANQVVATVTAYIAETIKEKGRLETYDCLLLTDANFSLFALDKLAQIIDPYRVIYDRTLELSPELQTFLGYKCAWKLDVTKPAELIRQITYYFFPGQSGIRTTPLQINISPNYFGPVNYRGSSQLDLEIDYGNTFQPLLSWGIGFHMDSLKDLEFWLEFQKDDGCDLQLIFEEVGSIPHYSGKNRYVVTGSELKWPSLIRGHKYQSSLMITLYAKGKGKITIGTLHSRWSRGPFGNYFLGGKRTVDPKREEVYSFFSPGNLKPPLCVYFSGYRSLEGFEGYFMMRSLKHPFLLITDPRLEGGAFYIGTKEYEQQVKAAIEAALKRLNFTNEQLILSGMSMGTFGALYYGAQLSPHAIILNKPLIHLGQMAAKIQTARPYVFGTSLDLLLKMTARNDVAGADSLDQRIWATFSKGDFEKTTFAIAYMENDDYDLTAFNVIMELLASRKSQAKLISQGFLGRHNDDFIENAKWFKNQYKRILAEDFTRGAKQWEILFTGIISSGPMRLAPKSRSKVKKVSSLKTTY